MAKQIRTGRRGFLAGMLGLPALAGSAASMNAGDDESQSAGREPATPYERGDMIRVENPDDPDQYVIVARTHAGRI